MGEDKSLEKAKTKLKIACFDDNMVFGLEEPSLDSIKYPVTFKCDSFILYQIINTLKKLTHTIKIKANENYVKFSGDGIEYIETIITLNNNTDSNNVSFLYVYSIITSIG